MDSVEVPTRHTAREIDATQPDIFLASNCCEQYRDGTDQAPTPGRM